MLGREHQRARACGAGARLELVDQMAKGGRVARELVARRQVEDVALHLAARAEQRVVRRAHLPRREGRVSEGRVHSTAARAAGAGARTRYGEPIMRRSTPMAAVYAEKTSPGTLPFSSTSRRSSERCSASSLARAAVPGIARALAIELASWRLTTSANRAALYS